MSSAPTIVTANTDGITQLMFGRKKKSTLRARTYHDIIFKRRGNPLGRVEDEKRAKEAQKKIQEESAKEATTVL
jgi:hypothetical protein